MTIDHNSHSAQSMLFVIKDLEKNVSFNFRPIFVVSSILKEKTLTPCFSDIDKISSRVQASVIRKGKKEEHECDGLDSVYMTHG